jgi:hypothetical protein
LSQKRNLVFFCARGKQTEDFREVARKIRARAPDIAPLVFTTRAAVGPMLAAPWLIQRPTVAIELDGRRGRPRIFRGLRLGHFGVSGKIAQYEALDAHGLPVPDWTEITPDTALDPAKWGPYVVVKPSRGKRGAYVWVHRTGRVRFKAPAEYPENHPARDGPMLAQRFIYTGPWPLSYRVLTYFGTPLISYRHEGRRDLPSLDGTDGLKRAGGGLSIVAAAKGGTAMLVDKPEIVELARRVHDVFPTIPSLGIDIVEEKATGRLFILEVNPGGQSWTLTSDAGVAMQAEFGIDFHGQFDALDLIADRSIEIAREYAR